MVQRSGGLAGVTEEDVVLDGVRMNHVRCNFVVEFVESEASWETRDTTDLRFCTSSVKLREEVFVHLRHGEKILVFVQDLYVTTHSNCVALFG